MYHLIVLSEARGREGQTEKTRIAVTTVQPHLDGDWSPYGNKRAFTVAVHPDDGDFRVEDIRDAHTDMPLGSAFPDPRRIHTVELRRGHALLLRELLDTREVWLVVHTREHGVTVANMPSQRYPRGAHVYHIAANLQMIPAVEGIGECEVRGETPVTAEISPLPWKTDVTLLTGESLESMLWRLVTETPA